MKESILNGKWVLGINDNPNVLKRLEEKIKDAAPNCHFEKATTYQEAFGLLIFFMYDLVILDNKLPRSRELLDFSVNRPSPVPVVMLTSHSTTLDTLKFHKELKTKVVFLRQQVDDFIPVLEYLVWHKSLPPFMRFLENLIESFNVRHLFSKNWDYKGGRIFSTSKGYKADIILKWKHSYLELKNHLNGYFESCPEESNLRWPEWKSLSDINGMQDVKV
jgi:CheY-like chemotaxis protein